MIKIKICGLTNLDDALLATNLGADYLGFNFYKNSPRIVSVSNAKTIISKLPGFVIPVGIFVDENIDIILKTVKKCGFKMVQFHGSETPEYCAEIKSKISVPVIKAFRIFDDKSTEIIGSYLDTADYFLLDSYVPGEQGGTGEVFNWDIALKVKELNKPFFLSGGLNSENISQAIEKVRPFAVDVASGVERLQRRKDYEKMKSFITQAKKT